MKWQLKTKRLLFLLNMADSTTWFPWKKKKKKKKKNRPMIFILFVLRCNIGGLMHLDGYKFESYCFFFMFHLSSIYDVVQFMFFLMETLMKNKCLLFCLSFKPHLLFK